MNMSFSDICWLSLSLTLCVICIYAMIGIHKTMPKVED